MIKDNTSYIGNPPSISKLEEIQPKLEILLQLEKDLVSAQQVTAPKESPATQSSEKRVILAEISASTQACLARLSSQVMPIQEKRTLSIFEMTMLYQTAKEFFMREFYGQGFDHAIDYLKMIVTIAIDSEYNVNTQIIKGKTLLHLLIDDLITLSSHKDVVREGLVKTILNSIYLLMQIGADPYSTDENGKTPFQCLAESGNTSNDIISRCIQIFNECAFRDLITTLICEQAQVNSTSYLSLLPVDIYQLLIPALGMQYIPHKRTSEVLAIATAIRNEGIFATRNNIPPFIIVDRDKPSPPLEDSNVATPHSFVNSPQN